MFSGYWNRADETIATLKNGWLYTGDIAKMDEDGYFFIVGRKKDMILAKLQRDVDYSFLSKLLIEAGFDLQMFREEDVNLETAFMELTKGTQQ